jgi:hypothetical protein
MLSHFVRVMMRVAGAGERGDEVLPCAASGKWVHVLREGGVVNSGDSYIFRINYDY